MKIEFHISMTAAEMLDLFGRREPQMRPANGESKRMTNESPIWS